MLLSLKQGLFIGKRSNGGADQGPSKNIEALLKGFVMLVFTFGALQAI